MQIKKITILGAGAWGTALAQLFSRSVDRIILWAHEKDVADSINQRKTNERYLPGFIVSSAIEATTDLAYACAGTDCIIEAIPMAYLASVIKRIDREAVAHIPFVVTSKGVYSKQVLFPTEVLHKHGIDYEKMIVLVGPTFAQEIMKGAFSGFCLASLDPMSAHSLGVLMKRASVAVQYSKDLLGVQIGGALKNVIAIGLGMLAAQGEGENMRALALVRGFQEIYQYGMYRGAESETLLGLAGLGDVVLTSLSSTSKNYTVGYLRGQGYSMDEIIERLSVLPEGCNTVRLYGEHDMFFKEQMTFCSAIYAVICKGADPKAVATVLRTDF